MQEAALRAGLKRVMEFYAFDALSHYLYPEVLSPAEHLRIYNRGHCLDLAVALSFELEGGQIVGQVKPSLPPLVYSHYALLVRTGADRWWLDPSLGVCTPLEAGAEFYLGKKLNRIKRVWSSSFDLSIDGTRQISIHYEKIAEADMARQQEQIHRTRRDLTLRYGGEQIRYLWRQGAFAWGNRLLLPFEFTEAEQDDLNLTFGFAVVPLLRVFAAAYRQIPESYWSWTL